MLAMGGMRNPACYVRPKRLANLLGRQQPLIDRLFGQGTYRIDSEGSDSARLSTDWMELLLTYDHRDQFVSSSVKPLKLPAELSENHTTDTLLRFYGMEARPRRKSQLDEQQVVDELELVEPLVEPLKVEQESRDATMFVRGYNAAYTDRAGGVWG